MICKRLRLNERRYKPPPEFKEGPIMRPCLLRSEMTTVRQDSLSTPRSKRSEPDDHQQPSISPISSSSSPTTISSEKTPLILITLSIPPEAKTLVPKYIKRDPRKNPPFCQQHLSIAQKISEQRRDSLPDIFIRGFEILENNKIATGSNNGRNGNDNHPIHNNELDGLYSSRTEGGNIFGLTPEFMFNFDGYEMDNFGHLPGDTRTPTPLADGYRPLCMRRTPSPSTKQIIRVDVKVNRKTSKKNNLNNGKN